MYTLVCVITTENQHEIDQSVKSLCDIWRPQDIPAVYTSSKAPLASSEGPHAVYLSQRLAKPAAPSSLLALNRLSPSQPSLPTAPVLIQSTGTSEAEALLVPVRGFVHAVLKRSRTSGGVLQIALCYLEAIRPKLAELIRQENEGTGVRGDPQALSTVTPTTEEELALEAELVKAEEEAFAFAYASINTTRIYDDCQLSSPHAFDQPPDLDFPSPPKPTTTEYAALLPLPSPLLYPRRSFLVALILASKLTQDKCYSNRAWAKLSSLSIPSRDR
jgi:PHO85 cyclin-5